MLMPIFSAAHSAQLSLQNDADLDTDSSSELSWAQDRPGARWKRVRGVDENGRETSWGFELDLAPSESRGTRRRTGRRRETCHVSASTTPQFGSHATMGLKTHTWISLWFLLTAPVILWDAGYCFMRPRSMIGGDLHWIWEPYGIYQNIDYVYGVKALQAGDGFTNAQSLLNIIETLFNLTYLYTAYVLAWPPATLIGFAAATMTLSKTVLYWAQEAYCGGCSVGHNSMGTLLVYWVLPNGLWLIVPSLIIYQFSKDLAGSLHIADRVGAGASKEKKAQ